VGGGGGVRPLLKSVTVGAEVEDRDFSNWRAAVSWLQISVGTKEENDFGIHRVKFVLTFYSSPFKESFSYRGSRIKESWGC